MFDLGRIYKPITAKPIYTEYYVELPPCDALKPFIRCFWGTPLPIRAAPTMVASANPLIIIPDTCFDIIFEKVDQNEANLFFCGINDSPFMEQPTKYRAGFSVFAIRFKFWTVHLFSDTDMSNVLNTFNDPDGYFSDFRIKLYDMLIEKKFIQDKIIEVEKYLLKRLEHIHTPNPELLNAVYHIIQSRGHIPVTELCEKTAVSMRRLERLFHKNIGVSPKKIADLVRFQNVWQDLYYSRETDIQDIIFKYDFADQSHLINDFKKYAGRTPFEALAYARK